MNISKSTFYRDIAELTQKGIVKKVDEGYSITTQLFPVYFSNEKKDQNNAPKINKVEEFRAELDKIKNNTKEEAFVQQPVYPMYRIFYYYYNKGFEGLKMSPEEFVMNLSAGFFTKKKADWEPVPKPVIDYRKYGF